MLTRRLALRTSPHSQREAKKCSGTPAPAAPRLPPSNAAICDRDNCASRRREAPRQRWERWEAFVHTLCVQAFLLVERWELQGW